MYSNLKYILLYNVYYWFVLCNGCGTHLKNQLYIQYYKYIYKNFLDEYNGFLTYYVILFIYIRYYILLDFFFKIKTNCYFIKNTKLPIITINERSRYFYFVCVKCIYIHKIQNLHILNTMYLYTCFARQNM